MNEPESAPCPDIVSQSDPRNNEIIDYENSAITERADYDDEYSTSRPIRLENRPSRPENRPSRPDPGLFHEEIENSLHLTSRPSRTENLPSRPDPGLFHEQIENQFDFNNDPLNPMNYYENEAVEQVKKFTVSA